MRPRDFYDLSLSLSATAQTEAERRTAVNRLYYGLHHEACCRYFRRNPHSQPIPTNRRHGELSQRFNNPLLPQETAIANEIRSLLRMRTECDYEISSPLRHQRRAVSPEEMLRLATTTAKKLWAALESYSPGGTPDGCECKTAQRYGDWYIAIGAEGGTRTHTPVRATDFKSAASAIPPPRHVRPIIAAAFSLPLPAR